VGQRQHGAPNPRRVACAGPANLQSAREDWRRRKEEGQQKTMQSIHNSGRGLDSSVRCRIDYAGLPYTAKRGDVPTKPPKR
jgi:hypothetical protein